MTEPTILQAQVIAPARPGQGESSLSGERLLWMYEMMLRIRQFEERCHLLFLQGGMPGTIHLYHGQEAVAVGVCANLTREDYITSTHRPHGHGIAKGVSLRAMMAELFGRDTGCCRGKGGSMHVGDPETGALPAIAIVAGGIPVAAGLGLAAKMRRTGNVVACFFGDGASSEGAFHEGVNMASIWDLPVVFVCENNLYGASTHVSKIMRVANVADRAPAYGIPGVTVDGNDVVAVWEATRSAVERARAGQGPTLLECKTYRRGGHSRSDPGHYRPKEEVETWFQRDPLEIHSRRLAELGVLSPAEAAEVSKRVEREIDDAVEFARSSPFPGPEELERDVFSEGRHGER